MFHKFHLNNGMMKLINLRNVNVIDYHKTRIAFIFNATQHEGFLMIGNGGINANVYKEEIT